MQRVSSLTLCVALVVGCASRPVGPVDVLAAYTQNLREGRFVDAWMMLSSEARQNLPYLAFEQQARAHPDEVRDAVLALGSPDPRAPVTARMELASGEAIMLVQESGQWRLDPSALEFYGQHTPRQSLRAFVRALARHRWDVLVRLAPRATVAAMSEPPAGAAAGAARVDPAERLRVEWSRPEAASSVQQTLAGLQQALDRNYPIEVVGERASMQYGIARGSIAQLVREDGLWKIEHTE